jgi:thiol-disulfide isomerase/thioredoxin
MKYLFLYFCLLSNISFATTLHVNIEIKGIKDGTIIYLEDGAYIDSTIFKNENARLTFNKKSTEPVQISIYTKGRGIAFVPYIDNQDLFIKGTVGQDPQAFNYTGSKTTNDLLLYLSLKKPEQDAIAKLWEDKNRDDKTKLLRKQKLDSIDKVIIEKDKVFASKYPYSYITPGLPMLAYRNHKIDKQEAVAWFNTLPNESKNTTFGEQFLILVNKYNTLHNGDAAPEIIALDADKKPFKLSDFNSKDVLLIFWSSWCGPCRAELPELKQLQKANPNVQFISYSLDDDDKVWHKAINELKIPWINISDLKGFTSEAGLSYGVSSIPRIVYIKGGIIKDEHVSIGTFSPIK